MNKLILVLVFVLIMSGCVFSPKRNPLTYQLLGYTITTDDLSPLVGFMDDTTFYIDRDGMCYNFGIGSYVDVVGCDGSIGDMCESFTYYDIYVYIAPYCEGDYDKYAPAETIILLTDDYEENKMRKEAVNQFPLFMAKLDAARKMLLLSNNTDYHEVCECVENKTIEYSDLLRTEELEYQHSFIKITIPPDNIQNLEPCFWEYTNLDYEIINSSLDCDYKNFVIWNATTDKYNTVYTKADPLHINLFESLVHKCFVDCYAEYQLTASGQMILVKKTGDCSLYQKVCKPVDVIIRATKTNYKYELRTWNETVCAPGKRRCIQERWE